MNKAGPTPCCTDVNREMFLFFFFFFFFTKSVSRGRGPGALLLAVVLKEQRSYATGNERGFSVGLVKGSKAFWILDLGSGSDWDGVHHRATPEVRMNPLSRQPRKMDVHLHVRYQPVHSRHGHQRKESCKNLSCTRSEHDFVDFESNVYIQGMLCSVFMVK